MKREVALAQFGENMKKLRRERNLSQEDCANICGLDRTYLSGLERGKRNPTLLVILKIATELQVDPRKLIVGIQWRHSE